MGQGLRQGLETVVALAALLGLAAASRWSSEVVHAWRQLDFAWPSEAARLQALTSGSFVPANCALAGVKVDSSERVCPGQMRPFRVAR